MVCPECQAEYRDGFAVCADCQIPLVAEFPSPSAPRPPESPVGPVIDPRTIWKGLEERGCVSLCLQLRDAAIPYAVAQKIRSRDGNMRVTWAYELSVSASDAQRARELLSLPELTAEEESAESEPEDEAHDTADDGFPAYPRDDDEDPFCGFWEGDDPRICAEICGVLDEATIPHRVLRREANLFRLSPASQMKIGVPFSLYERAEQIVVAAFGTGEEAQRLLGPVDVNRPSSDESSRE